jgi:hypothetical protein
MLHNAIKNFLHFQVKRKICRIHVNYLKNIRHRLSQIDYVRYHQLATIGDNGTESPELTHLILSDNQKIKLVKNRLRDLLEKQKGYLAHTRNRIIPEDIYELRIWRRELNAIGWEPRKENIKICRTVHFHQD